MSPVTFEHRFCEHFQCSGRQYESRALRRCLYWHARLVVPGLRRLLPGVFQPDLELIRRLGLAADFDDASVEVLSFQDYNFEHWSFARSVLRLRISGRAARRLVREVYRVS